MSRTISPKMQRLQEAIKTFLDGPGVPVFLSQIHEQVGKPLGFDYISTYQACQRLSRKGDIAQVERGRYTRSEGGKFLEEFVRLTSRLNDVVKEVSSISNSLMILGHRIQQGIEVPDSEDIEKEPSPQDGNVV